MSVDLVCEIIGSYVTAIVEIDLTAVHCLTFQQTFTELALMLIINRISSKQIVHIEIERGFLRSMESYCSKLEKPERSFKIRNCQIHVSPQPK